MAAGQTVFHGVVRESADEAGVEDSESGPRPTTRAALVATSLEEVGGDSS